MKTNTMNFKTKISGKESFELVDEYDDGEFEPLTCSLKKSTSRFCENVPKIKNFPAPNDKKRYQTEIQIETDKDPTKLDLDLREEFLLEKDKLDSIERQKGENKIVAATVFMNQFSKNVNSGQLTSNRSDRF